MTVKDRAMTWWLGRSVRERWMLAALGVVLAGVFGWYGVLTPLRWGADAAADRRARAAAALALTADFERAGGERRAPASGSLAAIVDASAAAAGVTIDRRREDAGGRLTVWIGAIDPKTLMQWIVNLRRGHAVGVVAMQATKVDGAALEVEISFSGAGR